MANIDGTNPGYPKKSVYVYSFCVRVRFPRKVEIAHGRDGGTNQPHHPKHGKRDTLHPERVNN
jgi:hypothetical protein